MSALGRALLEAFDAHERYREALRRARAAHKEARERDERVRVLQRLERARAGSKPRRVA